MVLIRRLALLVLVTTVLALGCTTHGHQIYNVNAAPVATKSGKALSIADVSQAIVRAGASVGWIIAPDGPGQLTGRYISGRDGRHSATVSIEHDTKVYAIKYKDSQGMNAEAGDNTIHRAYNQWVQSLDKAIAGQFGTM